MKLARMVWVDGRFAWWFVAAWVVGTVCLLWFDYYWRTHDTSFGRFF